MYKYLLDDSLVNATSVLKLNFGNHELLVISLEA